MTPRPHKSPGLCLRCLLWCVMAAACAPLGNAPLLKALPQRPQWSETHPDAQQHYRLSLRESRWTYQETLHIELRLVNLTEDPSIRGYDGCMRPWSDVRIDCYASSWDVRPTSVTRLCGMHSIDFLAGTSREGVLRFSIYAPRSTQFVRVSLDGDYVVSDDLPIPPP